MQQEEGRPARSRGETNTILISSPKSLEVQGLLWEEPLRGHGHCRTVIGDLAERLTIRRFGGVRLKTDSRCDYCPDIKWNWQYVECKAVGRTKQAFVYAGRLEKDREFALGHSLVYVIWHHLAETKRATTVQELERLVERNLQALYVVPFEFISALCDVLPIEKLNSKYGRHGSQEYGSGYRFPLSKLERWRQDPIISEISQNCS